MFRPRSCSIFTTWPRSASPCHHWATTVCSWATIETLCQSTCPGVSWSLCPLTILSSSTSPRSDWQEDLHMHTCLTSTVQPVKTQWSEVTISCLCRHISPGASDGRVQHCYSGVEVEFLWHVRAGKKQCPDERLLAQGKQAALLKYTQGSAHLVPLKTSISSPFQIFNSLPGLQWAALSSYYPYRSLENSMFSPLLTASHKNAWF